MTSEQLLQNPLVAAVNAHFGDAVAPAFAFSELTFTVGAARIVELCRYLREKQGFNRLSGSTCVDWHPEPKRFEVVYHLQNTTTWSRLRVKARTDGEIESLCSVWKGANWYEREVFDMFGVKFINHPNLRRILMPEDWEGHPLRKDYPVHGHRYSYKDE